MDYLQALQYQKIALRVGAFLIGTVCVIGAIQQLGTGTTTGREGRRQGGKHVVRRSEMPAYFWFLFFIRLVLGVISLLCGLLLQWQ